MGEDQGGTGDVSSPAGTAWRYVTETVALLAARSPKLPCALAQAWPVRPAN